MNVPGRRGGERDGGVPPVAVVDGDEVLDAILLIIALVLSVTFSGWAVLSYVGVLP